MLQAPTAVTRGPGAVRAELKMHSSWKGQQKNCDWRDHQHVALMLLHLRHLCSMCMFVRVKSCKKCNSAFACLSKQAAVALLLLWSSPFGKAAAILCTVLTAAQFLHTKKTALVLVSI